MTKSINSKRLIAGTFLTGLVAFTGFISLILNPQCLFAHNVQYDKFSIYSNYEIELNDIKTLLITADEMLQKSELYDPAYEYEIFFSHNTFYNKLDNILFDPNAAARPTDNNLIVKERTDVKKGITYTDRSEIDLQYLLVHEMIHYLQENKYGKLKFNPFQHPPMWKLEGYPEYIARQDQLNHPDYDLKLAIKNYLELEKASTDYWVQVEEKHFMPTIYLKGRLMIEYLMDIKQLSYDAILKEEVEATSVYAEMLQWMESH